VAPSKGYRPDLSTSRRRILDICIGSTLVYFAICIYELGNFVVLSTVATQASISFVGILPIGVSAVTSDQQLLPLAKPLQVLVCSGLMFMILRAVRSKSLPVSTILATATLSIYLASSYWEVLSLVGPISYEVHMGIFTSLALATQLGLSRLFKV
jgi:hypothetical protein